MSTSQIRLLTMESRSRLAPPGVCAGSARGPFGVRSGSIRDPFGVRSGFVRDPFGVCSGSVRGPFGVRSESVRGPKRKTPMYYWSQSSARSRQIKGTAVTSLAQV